MSDQIPGPGARAPEPPQSRPIGPAVATFGVASAALAAAVVIAGVTADDGAANLAGADPVGPGTGSTTTGSGVGTTGPAPAAGYLVADWTGEVSAGGETNGVIVTIESDADPAAIAGYLQVADPLDGSYSLGGILTGSLDGTTLALTSNVGATFTLTVDGDTLSGTGQFPGNGAPLPVQMQTRRA